MTRKPAFFPDRRLLRHRALSLVAAVLGTAIFTAAHLPLPFLLGPMLGCLVFALAGAPLAGMGAVGAYMRTILGVAVGATVTPALLQTLPGMAATLVLIPVFVAVIGAIGYPFFRRVMGFDPPTAFYSAMPGGLQDMLVFGAEAGGDVRAMSLVHATRVLIIVTAAPVLMHLIYGADLTRPPGEPIWAIPPAEIALMIAAGFTGWKIAERIGLFGASILGPLILTAALSLSGLLHHRPPAEFLRAAQFFIGIAVGSQYAGITLRELRIDVSAGIAYSAILAVISLAFIEAVRIVSPAPALDILLAFLPGGQAEMAVIAIIAGADVGFVVAHHLTRIFVVIMLAPLVARRVTRDTPDE